MGDERYAELHLEFGEFPSRGADDRGWYILKRGAERSPPCFRPLLSFIGVPEVIPAAWTVASAPS